MEAWTPEQLKSNLDQGERIFLKLWKRSCGICKLSTPATDRMEKDNQFQMKFAKICIDDHPEMLEITGSDVLPVFFVFDKKKKLGMFPGFKGLDKLQEFVENSLGA
ncbi:MAG: thioredoxin family protein [Proteobacteria bacterium]|nr:thioredoxin family protein [Pseudomonadota bacterium]